MHYIQGGITLVVCCLLGFECAVLLAISRNPQLMAAAQRGGGTPPEFTMTLLVVFLGIIAAIGLGAGLLTLLSGRWIKTRRRRAGSFAAAAFNCLLIPYGTVLGILTFIVLSRDSVRGLYTGGNRG